MKRAYVLSLDLFSCLKSLFIIEIAFHRQYIGHYPNGFSIIIVEERAVAEASESLNTQPPSSLPEWSPHNTSPRCLQWTFSPTSGSKAQQSPSFAASKPHPSVDSASPLTTSTLTSTPTWTSIPKTTTSPKPTHHSHASQLHQCPVQLQVRLLKH